MFTLLGILSQNKMSGSYTNTPYDNVVLEDSPLIYFPLTKESLIPGANNVISPFKQFGLPNSEAYPTSLHDSNPILVANTGKSTVFSGTSPGFIALSRSIDSRLNLYQNKSIELWFRYSSSTNQELISDLYTVGNNAQFTIHTNTSTLNSTNKIGFSRNSGSWSHCISTSSLTVGNVYHVVVTWNTTTALIYLNGVLDKSQAFTTITKTTGTIRLGIGHNTAPSAVTPISHLAIYDSVLSAERVLAHYNEGI